MDVSAACPPEAWNPGDAWLGAGGNGYMPGRGFGLEDAGERVGVLRSVAHETTHVRDTRDIEVLRSCPIQDDEDDVWGRCGRTESRLPVDPAHGHRRRETPAHRLQKLTAADRSLQNRIYNPTLDHRSGIRRVPERWITALPI